MTTATVNKAAKAAKAAVYSITCCQPSRTCRPIGRARPQLGPLAQAGLWAAGRPGADCGGRGRDGTGRAGWGDRDAWWAVGIEGAYLAEILSW